MFGLLRQQYLLQHPRSGNRPHDLFMPRSLQVFPACLVPPVKDNLAIKAPWGATRYPVRRKSAPHFFVLISRLIKEV
jgi:hypothetical protein